MNEKILWDFFENPKDARPILVDGLESLAIFEYYWEISGDQKESFDIFEDSWRIRIEICHLIGIYDVLSEFFKRFKSYKCYGKIFWRVGSQETILNELLRIICDPLKLLKNFSRCVLFYENPDRFKPLTQL